MSTVSLGPARPDRRAATLSALVPGWGQIVQGRTESGLIAFATCLTLTVLAASIGRVAGPGAEMLTILLFVVPCWVFQSYDASLANEPAPATLRRTADIVRERGHDIRYLGALFLMSAIMDLYIIAAQPQYALAVFCTKPEGWVGLLFKAQSPAIHTGIGYGFLRRQRWALLLYLLYAGFGLINASVNLGCFGYGRVRTVFLITLLAFTAYVLLRRRAFR
jgi:hypothetical protein